MKDIEDIERAIDEEDAYDVIEMTDEDGNNSEYYVLDAVESDGINYILAALADTCMQDDEDMQVCIFKETSTKDDDCIYEIVTDDNERQKIAVLLQESDPDYEIRTVDGFYE